MVTNKPVLLYDDRCSECTVFAKYAFKYSRGQLNCIGHYSKEGEKLRKIIFPPNYNETEMFWILTANRAYGGRSGLLLLLVMIIKGLVEHKKIPSRNFPDNCINIQMCENNRFKIKRLHNLLRIGKKLDIKSTRSVNF